MKTKDVVVGKGYTCRSGPCRIPVLVVEKVEEINYRLFGPPIRILFRVQREGATKPLPKLRSAAALEEL